MIEEPKKWKKPSTTTGPAPEAQVITVPVSPEKANRALMVKAANAYINAGGVTNFAAFPLHDKMSAFARTPKKFVKTRSLGGVVVPYVEGVFAQKVLNFIFNFDISQEITDMKLVEMSIQTKNGAKKAHLGAVTCKFTFHDPRTGRDIIRTVRSSHQMFGSPATTPDDAIKAAISKSWTLAAKSFGLFADIKDVDREEEVEAKVETGEINQPQEKDFDFS